VGLGFLAGRVVTLGYCLVEPESAPWLEHEGKRLPLHPVNPTHNARRRREKLREEDEDSTDPVDFDPPKALLDLATGRRLAGEDA
jgi:hypothetical protein